MLQCYNCVTVLQCYLLFRQELFQGDLVLGHELVLGRGPFHAHRVVGTFARTEDLVDAAQRLFRPRRFVGFSLSVSGHAMPCHVT